MGSRRWNLVKKFRALGSKIAGFLDFLASARNELSKRLHGEWAHEPTQVLSREQVENHAKMESSLRQAKDTENKVERLTNMANQAYRHLKEIPTDRSSETHRLVNTQIEITYENFHRISPIKLIPTHERKQKKNALSGYWGRALLGMALCSMGVDGCLLGVKAGIEIQKAALYSSAMTYTLPGSMSPRKRHLSTEERYDIGTKGNDALKSLNKMLQKALSPTKLDPPDIVYVPLYQVIQGLRTREKFDIPKRHKELKIGVHHVPYD